MTPEDMAALLAPVERYLRNPQRIECPECNGRRVFPAGVLGDEPTDCPLCDATGLVGREVWIEFMRDDA